jgi:hypothetical protein
MGSDLRCPFHRSLGALSTASRSALTPIDKAAFVYQLSDLKFADRLAVPVLDL